MTVTVRESESESEDESEDESEGLPSIEATALLSPGDDVRDSAGPEPGVSWGATILLGVEKVLPLNGDAAEEGVEARGRACLFCAGPAD